MTTNRETTIKLQRVHQIKEAKLINQTLMQIMKIAIRNSRPAVISTIMSQCQITTVVKLTGAPNCLPRTTATSLPMNTNDHKRIMGIVIKSGHRSSTWAMHLINYPPNKMLQKPTSLHMIIVINKTTRNNRISNWFPATQKSTISRITSLTRGR